MGQSEYFSTEAKFEKNSKLKRESEKKMPPKRRSKAPARRGGRARRRRVNHDHGGDTFTDVSSTSRSKTLPSPTSAYMTRSRQLLLNQCLASAETGEETHNRLEHTSPVKYNATTSQVQGEHEDCESDIGDRKVDNAIRDMIKSVLSPCPNSVSSHPKNVVRVGCHKPASIGHSMVDMQDETSCEVELGNELEHTRFIGHNAATLTEVTVPHQARASEHENCRSDVAGENVNDLSTVPSLLQDFTTQHPKDSDEQLQQEELIYNKNSAEIRGDIPNHSNSNYKRSVSLNFTEMMNAQAVDSDDDECSSGRDNSHITVGGYQVRKEHAQTLRSIISKYRDIAADSPLEHEKIHSLLLEQTCEVVEKLQVLDNLTKVTLTELESMRKLVTSMGNVIDVKWLAKRFDDIIEAKNIMRQSWSLREERVKKEQEIEETKKVCRALQDQLKKNDAKLAEQQDEMQIILKKREEATGKVKRFFNRSFAQDIL